MLFQTQVQAKPESKKVFQEKIPLEEAARTTIKGAFYTIAGGGAVFIGGVLTASGFLSPLGPAIITAGITLTGYGALQVYTGAKAYAGELKYERSKK